MSFIILAYLQLVKLITDTYETINIVFVGLTDILEFIHSAPSMMIYTLSIINLCACL